MPDFEDNTPDVLKRTLTVRIPFLRMNQMERDLVKKEFERISVGGKIDQYAFRLNIMGTQVPELISGRIFNMFASSESAQQQFTKKSHLSRYTAATTIGHLGKEGNVPTFDAMNLEDLECCYIFFKQQKPKEMAELSYELVKLSRDQENLLIEDLQYFCSHMIQENPEFVLQIYSKSNLDPRIPITRNEFVANYKNISKLEMFSFIPKLADGFKKEYLNINSDVFKDFASNLQVKFLGQMQLDTFLDNSKQVKGKQGDMLKDHDECHIRNFFDKKICNQNWIDVLETYRSLFKQMTNPMFVKVLIQSIIIERANYFDFFLELTEACVMTVSDRQVLGLVFDIFSEFQNEMSEEQFQTFCVTFDLDQNEIEIDKRLKEEFVDLFIEYSESFGHALRECQYTFISLMGISCTGSLEEQRNSILTLLDQELDTEIDVQTYIKQNLDLQRKYYIIDKTFWDRWLTSSQDEEDLITETWKDLGNNKKKKKDQNQKEKLAINNKSLLMQGHQARVDFDKFKYDQENGFIIVPAQVFGCLSHWYTCDQVIELRSEVNSVDSPAIEAARNFMADQEEKGEGQSIDFQEKSIDKEKESKKHKPIIFSLSADSTLLNDYQTKSGGDASAAGLVNNIDQPLSLKIKPYAGSDGENDEEEAQTYRAGSNPDFEKVVGDMQHNLDVCQIFLYFTQLGKDGDRPHKDVIVDGTLDTKYMKKNKLKSNPFKEVNLSKYQTLGTLLRHFCEVFGQEGGRIHIGDQVIEGMKLMKTLVELEIKSGQIAYVEFLGPDSNWPSDSVVKKPKKKKRGEMGETQGLVNTGNSCYMNAAIQCLVNIQPFYEFFVDTKTFERQINLVSDEGYKGDLALAFGNLIELLWTQDGVVTPKRFIHDQSQLNPQFNGDDQQDVMVYLDFLIDGMHEDINLIKQKVEIPTPSSQGRDLLELALESWSNTLRQEWSFIFFMMYGQQRTTLKCLNCSKESSSYSTFQDLSLDLVVSENVNLQIIVKRLPWKLKSNFRQDEQASEAKPQSEDQRLSRSFSKLTNNQQIRICVSVKNNIQISELITRVVVVPESNIDMDQYFSQKFTELVLYSQDHGIIRGVFDPSCKFTQYKLFGNEIFAQEVLTDRGREYIRLLYLRNQMMNNYNAGLLCNLRPPGEKMKEEQDEEQKDKEYQEFKETYIFNNQLAANEKFERLFQMKRLPSHILAVAYHRRFVQLQTSLLGKFTPELISQPIVIRLPLEPTGREIYDEIWALAHGILKPTSKYFDKNNLWWNKSNWQQILEKSKETSQLKPFVLKYVDRGAFNCSKCNWVEMCSGCVLGPDENQKIHKFLTLSNIAIEWHSQTISDDFDVRTNDIINHKSVSLFDKTEPPVQSLNQCLHKHYDAEVLNEELKCTRCREFQEHTKESQIFRPPPVLTIQLKRFKKFGFSWKKQNLFVDFPVTGLDLYDFMQDEEFNEDNGIISLYDLCGVICHFGSLTFGHYYSVVKNPFDQTWYKYDDHSKTPITESQIPKHNAYILFYQRKDTAKKNLNTIFPQNFSVFPGLPVNTKHGWGFVLGPKQPDLEDEDPFVYYIKITAIDKVVEYHIDDIKLMLQSSGHAYYEDADALHALNQKDEVKDNTSVFSKFGSLFGSKSKSTESSELSKSFRDNDQISQINSKNQKIKKLLIAKNDRKRLQQIDLKKIKPYDPKTDPRGAKQRNIEEKKLFKRKGQKGQKGSEDDEIDDGGVAGIAAAVLIGAAMANANDAHDDSQGADDRQEEDFSQGEDDDAVGGAPVIWRPKRDGRAAHRQNSGEQVGQGGHQRSKILQNKKPEEGKEDEENPADADAEED